MRINLILALFLFAVPLASLAEQVPEREPTLLEASDAAAEAQTHQIVVITDPEFVPISHYFATELNELPPSSAGLTNTDPLAPREP